MCYLLTLEDNETTSSVSRKTSQLSCKEADGAPRSCQMHILLTPLLKYHCNFNVLRTNQQLTKQTSIIKSTLRNETLGIILIDLLGRVLIATEKTYYSCLGEK